MPQAVLINGQSFLHFHFLKGWCLTIKKELFQVRLLRFKAEIYIWFLLATAKGQRMLLSILQFYQYWLIALKYQALKVS
ncbi:hypothetical protein BAZSYMA_ACONTIG12338_1 [Bathymodiolus azoricus thioautotrophic gill symbiont]|uniref:Uncharacterized protein n=1 Tax=Bathymodiolus azoricus thioautotrophic gill symbiont TaxID=235205 RepID=A0A1H6MHV6_9GAMM|nr:hypothetical protein BAZSYMA_ACONTIG12338_1 [Bathymodiolus azoricus thioautotrophic gill symbiont]